MSEVTPFPNTFEVYCKEHPEKFETRITSAKRTAFGACMILFILIACFPAITNPIPIISLFPKWMIIVIGIIGALFCLLMMFSNCEKLYNIESNGVIKHIGLKKFDRVNAKRDEVIDAFVRRDFDFLADAAETYNDPLQIYIFEDAVGKELYLHLREYASPSEFNGAADVLIVSGNEYDEYRSSIVSMGPIK